MAKKTTKNINKANNEIHLLENLVGDFMSYWGFKNIHGRIWLHLYTSTKALDSSELMSRLGVSKGLMSLAIRELLEYDVIRPTATGPHGTVYYETNPDLQGVINNVLKNRELTMLQQVQKATKNLLTKDGDDLKEMGIEKHRVKSLLMFTESAHTVLKSFLSLEKIENTDIFSGIMDANEW